MPHFHISGIHAVVNFLYIVAVFGALHLLAISMPSNKLSQSWLGLGF
jgi:hypothetical protein